MNRSTKILAAACAALALPASLGLAAGIDSTTDPTATSRDTTWQCPRATNGQMPVSFEAMRSWMRSGGHMGAGYGRMGYGQDGSAPVNDGYGRQAMRGASL